MRLLPAFLVTAFALPTLTSAIAHADQCAINDAAIAAKAVTIAKQSKRALEYCEPCGEKAPKAPFEINTVTEKGGQVFLNGKPVDLAYTFIHVVDDEYKNLGLAAGCSAKRVSNSVINTKPTRSTTNVPPPGPTPYRPMPRGPNSVPMTRVGAPDDLAGNWTMTMRHSLSTCGPQPKEVISAWSITVTDGEITVNTADGEELIGTQTALVYGMYRPELQPKSHPSGTIVQMTQSLKDRFWGKLVRIETTGQKRDPSCVTVIDISGSRAP